MVDKLWDIIKINVKSQSSATPPPGHWETILCIHFTKRSHIYFTYQTMKCALLFNLEKNAENYVGVTD